VAKFGIVLLLNFADLTSKNIYHSFILGKEKTNQAPAALLKVQGFSILDFGLRI
jgi:hypothetical protein